MRKYVLLLISMIGLWAPSFAAGEPGALWDKANQAYIDADYRSAIEGYDSIVRMGYAGHKLYYNLANAYFKNGEIGKAVLYYNKAQKLAPSDEDIRHNLAVANGYVKDNIEAVPEFFFKTWIRTLRGTMSSNAWAVWSIVLFASGLAALALFLLARGLGLRKAGFYGALACLVLFAVCVAFSSAGKRESRDGSFAVVMASAAPVKSSPDVSSKDIFVLHEGTKVKVIEQLNEWREITIADGNKGWILASSIETID